MKFADSVISRTGIILLFFSVLTALFYLPILPQINGYLIGPPEDNRQFYWFIWYGSEAILRPDWPFMHTTRMFYPEGMSLYFANYFYYGIAVTLLLKPFLSLSVIYNLLIMSSYVLSGLTAYWLIRHFISNRLACVMGAFVFAFNPSHFAHAEHHATIASIQWIPLFILAVLKTFRHKKAGWAVLAGFAMALCAWCDWNYLVYNIIFCVLYFAWRLRRREFLSDLKFWTITAVVSFLLLSPLLVPMLMLSATEAGARKYLEGADTYVADLLGFVVPHPYHLLGEMQWVKKLNGPMTGNNWEKSVYLGIINLILALFSFKIIKKIPAIFFGFTAFAILSLGISLHIKGHLTGIPLPYAVIDQIPLLKHARNPSRAIIYVYLFLSIATAGGIAYLFERCRKIHIKYAVAGILFILMFFDFFSQTKEVTAVAPPHAYEVIRLDSAEFSDDFAILDIPWAPGRYMMYQVEHGMRNVQGYIGRVLKPSLIHRLPFEINLLPVKKEMLKKNKVKYIIFHKKYQYHDPNNRDHQKRFALLAKMSGYYGKIYKQIYNDDEQAVYKVY